MKRGRPRMADGLLDKVEFLLPMVRAGIPRAAGLDHLNERYPGLAPLYAAALWQQAKTAAGVRGRLGRRGPRKFEG